jgi:hypothetical protein
MANDQNDEWIRINITTDFLKDGVELETGKNYELVFPVFRVHLEIDPSSADENDDKYTLKSTDGDSWYKKTLIVKDDKVAGDGYVSLVYPGIRDDLSYTLEVDPGGQGSKFNYFENLPYEEIIKDSWEEAEQSTDEEPQNNKSTDDFNEV